MIVSQHPGILSKIDTNAISKTWPKGERTARAIQDQVGLFRKEIQSGNFGVKSGGAPSTPNRSTTTDAKPKSNTKVFTPSVTPSKRASGSGARTPTSSAKKRRVTARQRDSDESEEPELTSEEEAPQADDTDEDEPLANVPTRSERRTLPARSKSRSKSYVAESDSEGRDTGARDTDGGVDSEFSLSKMNEEGKKKGGNAVGTLLRKMMAGKEKTVQNGDDGESGEHEGHEGGRVNLEKEREREWESDADSRSTKRMSWKSALEEI